MPPWKAKSAEALIEAAARGELNEAQALRLHPECPEIVGLALLAAAKRVAERQNRPVVILRKNNQSNRSDHGAATQAVPMSVYRPLGLRGLDPTKVIADALTPT